MQLRGGNELELIRPTRANGSLCTSQSGPATSPIALHILHLVLHPLKLTWRTITLHWHGNVGKMDQPLLWDQERTSVIKKQSDFRSRLLLFSATIQKHAISILTTGIHGKTMTFPAHVCIIAKSMLPFCLVQRKEYMHETKPKH
jgi:hypothetical protein